ncbi:hypothetical protein [Streptomyces cellostaticus]|uniref:hypothetical protein n=1 Tax=Streptomyces cellostaticus TaxID=67285 RepID=UPI00099E72B3|nr:hypothetical protein [Streptomyces cellostaticus]GHI07325.1 hypothetical protein Scel_56460 [Streptomyces cellostaticus]
MRPSAPLAAPLPLHHRADVLRELGLKQTKSMAQSATAAEFGRYFTGSPMVAGIVVAVSAVIAILAATAFMRFRFPFRTSCSDVPAGVLQAGRAVKDRHGRCDS